MKKEECIALLERYANYNGVGIPNLEGCKEAMLKAVELLSWPSLPSNLDEAAEEYADCNSQRWFEDGDIYYDRSKIIDAFKAGAKCRDAQIPKLPDDLDKAAIQAHTRLEDGEGLSFLNIFKAGVEWLAAQGETIDGVILTTSDYGWETIRIPKKLYPLGTEVTIQIRKKQ